MVAWVTQGGKGWSQAGPKGLQLESGALRAAILLVSYKAKFPFYWIVLQYFFYPPFWSLFVCFSSIWQPPVLKFTCSRFLQHSAGTLLGWHHQMLSVFRSFIARFEIHVFKILASLCKDSPGLPLSNVRISSTCRIVPPEINFGQVSIPDDNLERGCTFVHKNDKFLGIWLAD